MRSAIAGAWLALLGACVPPGPVPPPGPDASDSGPPGASCVAACLALATVGCPEGAAPACASTLAKVEADRLIRDPVGNPVTCATLGHVTSQAEARSDGIACGGL